MSTVHDMQEKSWHLRHIVLNICIRRPEAWSCVFFMVYSFCGNQPTVGKHADRFDNILMEILSGIFSNIFH